MMKQITMRLHIVLMIVLITLAVVAIIALALGVRPRILVTSSMEPSIYKNSLVLINTNAKYEELEEGEVIVFRAGNTEVMHRITGISEDGKLVVTPDKGQGLTLVEKATYVGKEVIAFPIIGGWLRSILEHGKAVVIGLGLVLVVLGCLPYGKARRKKQMG